MIFFLNIFIRQNIKTKNKIKHVIILILKKFYKRKNMIARLNFIIIMTVMKN